MEATTLRDDRRVSASEEAPQDTRARILQAAVRQCEEFGLRRTTMEDVARRSGFARATLYRYFQNKDALVQAAIVEEAERFFVALGIALASAERIEERVAEGFAFALQYVRGHALLQKLLRTEPEALLPYLLGDGRLIRVATDGIVALMLGDEGEEILDRRDSHAIAELAARLVLSLALSPDSVLGADDAEGAGEVARRYLVPSLQAARRSTSQRLPPRGRGGGRGGGSRRARPA